MPSKPITPAQVKQFKTADMIDVMYGEIQSMIENGKPDNVAFNYFLPGVPLGDEFAKFMDIGRKAKKIDNKDADGNVAFTANDMLRSMVNFAAMTDYVPELGTNPLKKTMTRDDAVDLNALISSGLSVSKLYKGVLDNCRVVDNSRSDEENAELERLRAILYKTPEPKPTALEPVPDADDDEDVDIDALLADGTETDDFVEDANLISEPTKIMKIYQALATKYEQVRSEGIDRLSKVSANNPNIRDIKEMVDARIRNAERRWESQGQKTRVEGIIARIEQLSRAGMPEYVSDLRNTLKANKVVAALIATDEGISALSEQAYYTALRPNGILNAPTAMKVELNSSNSQTWRRMSNRSTSGSVKGFMTGIPFVGSAKAKKNSEFSASGLFNEGFSMSYEIVQGIIDRPWLDLGFLESRAYTTVDPKSKKRLDQINEITRLSDGKVPPLEGAMRAIPMTAYFVRNLTLQSNAVKKAARNSKSDFSAKAGGSLFGFGASGKRTTTTTRMDMSQAESKGIITMQGWFLVALASRFTKLAPNPDFDSFPNPEDWV